MKKRVLSLLLAFVMLLGLLPTGALAADVTVISTAEEFAAMNSGGSYRLAADIEVTEPYAQFGGTFDGDGHTITLNLDTSSNNAALFGQTNSGAVIENLIVDANVAASGYGSTYGTAGLVGRIYGPTTIENCGVTGTVENTNSGYSSVNVGGLVGYLYDDLTMTNCYSTADVTAASTNYSSAVGGLVGGAGSYTLTAENCYAAGTVTAGNDSVKTGGFAGSLTKHSLSNCYYNAATANTELDGLASKTAEELMNLAADLGDGFLEDAGNINGGYPILSCQYFDPNATYAVIIQVTPADSMLTWDGVAQNAPEGGVYMFADVAVGEYAYTVSNEAGDYAPQTGTITVKNKDVTQAVNLELNTHSLTFDLTPDDAALTVKDSGENELTPAWGSTYTVTNGDYTYSVSQFGYEDATGTVTVDRADTEQRVTLTAKPAHTVTFAYGEAPDGGEVQNGSLTVMTGERVIEPTDDDYRTYALPVGYDYTYTFKSANYAKVEGTIELAAAAEAGSQTVTIPLTIKTAWGGADDISEPAQIDGVYQISSGSELAWLAQEVNARRGASYSAVLTKDIDLGDEAWTPIGQAYATRYAAAFDGQGHTVTGLNVTGSYAGNYGLFGYVEGGSVKNLTVEGEIALTGSGSSSYGSAGIVGCFSGTTGVIENCVNKATVTGQQNVGGVVGIISDGYGSNEKAVQSCANLGRVKSNSNKAGGIAGYVKGAVTVENCYNRGNVTGGGWYAGGITSYTDSSYCKIQNCYTTGTVSGSDAAAVIGKKYSGSVSGLYYLDGLTADGNATSKTEDEMKSADFVAELGDAFLTGGSLNNGYPILEFQVTKYPVTFTVSPAEAEVAIPGAAGEHSGNTWTFRLPAGEYDYAVSLFGYVAQSGSFTVTDSAVTETVTLAEAAKKEITLAVSPESANAAVTVTWNGETVAPKSGTTYELPYGDYHYLVKAKGYAKAEADFTVDAESIETISVTLTPSTAWDGESEEKPSGEGTEASPYQIGSGEELAWLAGQVNTAGGSLYVVLTDDIDLNNAAWTPIGSGYSAKFQGSFDGQGHTVSGLSVSGQEYAGLFGHADSATIQNLVVQGSVSGTSYAGGVVGRADSSVAVLNCGNEAEVSNSGTYGAGGIAGRFNTYGDETSAVSGCYNSGIIRYAGSGYGYAGGIAGYDNGKTPISNCYNTGAVTSGKYAGGIRGYGSSSAGAISGCYNIGAVTGDSASNQGGIAPGSYSSVSNCFYLSAGSDSNDGSAAKAEVEMKSADFAALLGEGWKRDDRTNGGYPILSWQPTAPIAETDNPQLIDAAFDWIPYVDETEAWQNSGEILPTLRWNPEDGVSAYDITLWSEYFAKKDPADPEDPYEIRVEKAATLTDITARLDEDGKLVYDLTETFASLPERRYYATVSPAGSAVPTLAYVQDNVAGYGTPYNRLKQVTGLHWEGTKACWDAKTLADIDWAFDEGDYYVLTIYRRDENGSFVAGTSTSIPGCYNKVDCSGYFAVGGTYAFTVAAGTGETKAGFGFADSWESLRSDDPSNGGAENGIYTVAATDIPGGEHGADWVAITSAEQWMALANLEDTYDDPNDPTTSVQAREWSKKYYLANDIDFSSLSAAQGTQTKSIGNVTHRFMGVLDGNGHKITGLTLSNYDSGLFWYLGSTGYVCNLTVESANILVSDNAAVIAHNNFGTIANCAVVNSNITADTGAVIGGMVSRNYGVIRDSFVEGGVLLSSSPTATGHAGFVGANEEGGLIERCWTSMEVNAQSDYAGGFVGLGYGGTIRNCFALGDVSARGYSGGFVGRSVYGGNVYENCYAAGMVTVSGQEGHGFIGGNKPDSGFQYDQSEGIANCWYNAASPADENATGAKTLEDMAAAAFVATLNGGSGEEIWTQDAEKNGGLPYLKGVKAPERPRTTEMTVTIAVAGYDKNVYAFSQLGDTVEVTLESNGNTRVVDVLDAAQEQGKLTYSYDTTPTFGRYIHTINGRPVEAPDGWMFTINDTLSNVSASLATVRDGDKLLWFEGTTENHFHAPTWEELADSTLEWADIATVDDLLALAGSTDAAALAKNYRLTADLDLAGVTFPGIGSAAAPFTGVFDGQNHTISNAAISGSENVGFFNVIRGATVKNLNLTGLQVIGEKKVGGLVGWAQVALNIQNTADSISNLVGSCSVSGTVTGRDTVGGLAGLNGGAYDADTGFSIASTVDKCTANVAVNGIQGRAATGHAKLGGLAGQNDGVITRCAATGAVSAAGSNMVGGLVGDNAGDIYESHAEGAVTGSGTVGGFAGLSTGTVKDSYCLGNVTGVENVGGFAGTIDAVENAVSAGTVTGGAGFAGTLNGQVTGVANQITAKNIFGNCVPDLSPVGNTSQFTSESQRAALDAMKLTARTAVAEKLQEVFHVTLPVPETLRQEAEKYTDAVAVPADAQIGDVISLLKSGMTAGEGITVTVEADGEHLTGGTALTLQKQNDTAATAIVPVTVKLTDRAGDTLQKTIQVILPVAAEKQSELMDAIAGTLTGSSDSWTVLDMQAYGTLDDKTAATQAQALQNALNLMIQTASGTASVSDRARLEIVLRSMGIDSTKLYPVNSNTPVDNADKLAKSDLTAGGYYAAPWILLADLQGNVRLSDSLRQSLIELLKANVGSGLFDYIYGDETYHDPDTAGAALAALAGLYETNADAKAIVDAILEALPGALDSKGSLGNANSDAMVIVGLVAMGKDPTDLKAVSGTSVVDGLLGYVNADGTAFQYPNWTTGAMEDNALATEQAFRALVAMAKAQGQAFNIYDFSRKAVTPGRATGEGETQKPDPAPSEGEDITVTIRIRSDSGMWLGNTSIALKKGSTVYHAFEKALANAGLTAVGAEDGYVKSITKGQTTLAEFDRGPNSGWLYNVNDQTHNVPLTKYVLEDGDEILWFYSSDYQRDPTVSSGGTSIDEPPVPLGMPFIDMDNHWAADAVAEIHERGLMVGTSAVTFSPDMTMSRAMLATVLYRLAGEPTVTSANSFADVPDGVWYTDAVTWASANEIVYGTGIGFAPDQGITRQELVTMLYRYARSTGLDISKIADLSGYTDSTEVSDWARESMGWAVANGLVTGRTATMLAPTGTATRAEVAVILQRLLKLTAG